MRITRLTPRLGDLIDELRSLPEPPDELWRLCRQGTQTIAAALYLMESADDSDLRILRTFVAKSKRDLARFAQSLGERDEAVCIVREMMALVSGEIQPPRSASLASDDDLDDGLDDSGDFTAADDPGGQMADLSRYWCRGCGQFTTCMKCLGCGTWMPGYAPYEPAPRRSRPSLLVPLLVLAVIAALGWLGWRYVCQRDPGPPPVAVRADALRHVPADWLVVQADPAQVEAYLTRLPAVGKWLAKSDTLEKQFPPTELDRQLEDLAGGTQWSVFAASPHAVARGLWWLRMPGNFAAPGDLVGGLRELQFQEELLRREPEFASLNVKSGAYRPDRVLPARLSVGALGGRPAWRVGDEYLLEAEPGILVRGTSRAGVARLASPPSPGPSHEPAPPGTALVLQLSPDFWRAPVWKGTLATDGKFDPAKVGTLQVVVKLAVSALAVEVRVPILDDALFDEARRFLEKQNRLREPPPFDWMEDVRPAIEGRSYVLRFEVPDAVVDRLIPTPEQAEANAAVFGQLRHMFDRR